MSWKTTPAGEKFVEHLSTLVTENLSGESAEAMVGLLGAQLACVLVCFEDPKERRDLTLRHCRTLPKMIAAADERLTTLGEAA